VQAWLRAERARELVVLRARQIAGPSLSWLLSLPAQEGLRVWLISPHPLQRLGGVEGVAVILMYPDATACVEFIGGALRENPERLGKRCAGSGRGCGPPGGAGTGSSTAWTKSVTGSRSFTSTTGPPCTADLR
jgi:hypothetical protein